MSVNRINKKADGSVSLTKIAGKIPSGFRKLGKGLKINELFQLTLDDEVTEKLDNFDDDNKLKDGALSDEVLDKLNGYSNENLLDNPFFTVNSRNFTEKTLGTTQEYTLDRWKSWRTKVKVESDGVSIAWNGTNGTTGIFANFIENSEALIGKTLTASAYFDGVLYTHTTKIPEKGTNNFITTKIGNKSIVWGLEYVSTNPAPYLVFICLSTEYTKLKAVKLELGSVSTLENDIAPNYELELAKCRLSKADPSDTYANQNEISVGISNPNLVDNGWFTVNQRGKTEYTKTNGATGTSFLAMDRWRFNTPANTTTTVKITDYGFEYHTTAANGREWILQYLDDEYNDALIGKDITISVMKYDGSIVSHVFNYANSTSGSIDWIANDNDIYLLRWQKQNNSLRWTPVIYLKDGAKIRAIKVELGSVSTLANDVTPKYETELRKCQRFFQRIRITNTGLLGFVQARSSTVGIWHVALSTDMRALPSITFEGSLAVRLKDAVGTTQATEYPVTSIAPYSVSGNNAEITVNVASGLVETQMYRMRANSEVYLNLTAEL